MGQHHQRQTRNGAAKRIKDRPPPADDLHDVAGEKLAGNARHKQQRAQPEAQRHGRTLVNERLGHKDRARVVAGAGGNRAQDADDRPAQLATAEQRRERRQLLALDLEPRPELGQCQRRHAIAGAPDDVVDGVHRRLRAPAAQQPARTVGQREIKQHRHDKQGQPAGQRNQPEAMRVAREKEADERQQGEGARQHDFINRAIGAAMLRRHQLGRDRERRRDRKAQTDAGQQAQCDQFLGILRQWDQQGKKRAEDDPDLHHRLAAQAIGQQQRDAEAGQRDDESGAENEEADICGREMKRSFGEDDQRAAERQIITLDKADQPQNQDQSDVVGGKRDRVLLPPQHLDRGIPTHWKGGSCGHWCFPPCCCLAGR